MKPIKLLTTFAVAMAVLITGCKKDDFVEVPGICPIVITTDPANLATFVPLNKIITATFNVSMNPETFVPEAFSLQDAKKSLDAASAGTLSYDVANKRMSFVPSVPLTNNTTYTATIKSTVKDLKGIGLQGNYVWTFSTGILLNPTVILTDPLNLATGVALNKTVSAEFSEEMNATTITGTTFTLYNGATPVAGAVTYAGTTASFNPTVDLLPGVLYTATITTGAKNLGGTALLANYVWSFTAQSPGPIVTLTDPLNLATNVVVNKTVTATFSTAMNPATITGTTFTLKNGATPVAGVVTYSGTTASFNPTVDLLPGVLYTATVTTGAQASGGTALANNYVWTFTTISAAPIITLVNPLNLATGVAVNQTVTATFNQAMNSATLTGTTFTLKDGATPVAGSVSYTGLTASFNPTVDLSPGVLYTATVTTGAQNTGGTGLAANYVWTFRTIGAAPTVTGTDPMNLATNVALSKTITATFSEAMNSATITATTITILNGVTPVVGAVTYSGLTATFNPTGNLLSGVTYTATITTGAQSAGGTPIAANYVWTFSTSAPLGPVAPDLAGVARFGIIAGVGVRNDAGFSVINDLDVGISPGARSSVTGFPPATIVNGAIYAADDGGAVTAMLIAAQTDLTNAYIFARDNNSVAPQIAPADLGGKTLAPGIYYSTSTMLLQNGDLTLDGQGDANAVWIFRIASAFTSVGTGPYPSPSGGNVILAGGAQAKNVYWQVGSSATIGDYTSFKGNILALSDITMNGYSRAEGRMLARNGTVVLTSTNIITKP